MPSPLGKSTNRLLPALPVLLVTLVLFRPAWAQVELSPKNKAAQVNPDTHLVITFPGAPVLGTSGQIRIYDAADDKLVDTLDLSIPPGPTPGGARGGSAPPTSRPYEYAPGRFTNANTAAGTPSGNALPTPASSQLTIIGGFTDGFHFYPVIIHDNTATIYPHNNLLAYDKTYYVQIDPGVLTLMDKSFAGFSGNRGWTFTTKQAGPAADARRLVVSPDGAGDFNTVQGAIDFIPDFNSNRVTIFLRNGTYEEIVYFRDKTNITILGEDREKVVVGYANNEVFNPHPANVGTNELPGTFPSRRAAFMADHSTGIHLVNFSITNFTKGQAEGLLLVGGQHIVSNVRVTGSGDALQVNDSAYLIDSTIIGDGDTLLGRGPVMFERCDWKSRGPFMWMRSTSASHGAVCMNCTFEGTGPTPTVIARAPTNGGKNYPNTEVVLIDCGLKNIAPALWGPLGGDTTNMHFWEYNTKNLPDGTPADLSQRHAAAKVLDRERDAQTIAHYRDPSYVLGWTPAMAPIVLKQPAGVSAQAGGSVTLSANVTAVPTAAYQWFKNGVAIEGATRTSLPLGSVKPADGGTYTLRATNSSGVVITDAAILSVK